ncbi:NfeD family protein [Sporosalibacterium faouarense]|uniref:NfeD family protein n=1 Tax=Sporosalibacterium faouarense TaxID=516123 RepID=UPI001FAF61E4|nr:NfeD family protein [Sporosalibacterium faouarense]
MTRNPKAIIFEIDTYGGYINEAEKIWKLISGLDIPTISYVNTKAESAGVLITISSDKIAMSDGSTIGSAETIPNTEKVLSMWVSWLRDAAESNGRNPQLVAAMADKSIEIPGVVKEGKLLNLNSTKAKELGLADVVANDYEEILNYLDIDYNNIVSSSPTLRTHIASLLSDPYISGILIILGFVGFVIEVMAPGFGAGGTLSFIAFTLYFSGNILAGNSGLGVVLIFLAGVVLIIIEALIPGFGITGIGGIVAISISIVLATNSIQAALLSLTLAIVISAVVLIILIKYGYKSPYLSKVILKENQDKDKGYIGISYMNKYLGKEGEAISFLRPAGIILIGDDRVDAVSQGDFIEKGSKVKVVKVEGGKVIVRKVN